MRRRLASVLQITTPIFNTISVHFSLHPNARIRKADRQFEFQNSPNPNPRILLLRNQIRPLKALMSTLLRHGDASDVDEAEEEEEIQRLEEEVEQLAQKILEYRTTLPDHLSCTLSSLLVSRRPVLPTHLVDQGSDPDTRALPGPESEVGVSQVRPTRENMALSVTDDPEEAEKLQLLKQKISSNASALPIVLKRMKEYMTRMDKLESSDGVIHPAFKLKWTS